MVEKFMFLVFAARVMRSISEDEMVDGAAL